MFINSEPMSDDELEPLHSELTGLYERYGLELVGKGHTAVKDPLKRRQENHRSHAGQKAGCV